MINTKQPGGLKFVTLCAAAFFAGPSGAEISGLPALDMHIFDDDSHLVTAPPVPQMMAADDSSNFQMVVFSEEVEQSDPAVREAIAESAKNDEFSFYYELGSGYQRDNVSWNVASPSGSPNPAVEAKWKDIDLWRLNGRFDIKTPIGVVVRGTAKYARALDGTAEQTGYLGDNRTLPYSQVSAGSDAGYVLGGSIGAGYRFGVGNDSVQAALTPLGGYAFNRQKLTLSDNSTSHYVAEWKGPWLGVDGTVSWLEAHELFASFEHHWADYDADANWKQSSGFAQPLSFTHSADATGWKGLFGYRYHTSGLWGMSLTFDYQRWDSDPGTEQAYLANGVKVESRLNEVTRESMGVNLGVNMKF